MTQFFVSLSIVILLFFLIKNKIKPAILFFTLVLVYNITDLIDTEIMLNNFTNSSLITLLLLLLVSIAFEKTLFISIISRKVFSKSYKKSLLKMSFFVSLFSAFLNNTAVVASMISVVKNNKFHEPSKLLLPLSYAAIFGGTITLVGTSTNLIVNGFIIERGLPSLSLFDFIYIGLPIALIGAFILLFVSKYLPVINKDKIEKKYFIEAKVDKSSKLVGKTIIENNLRHLEYLFLNEIIREDKIISPVNPNEEIKVDDILVFSGDIRHVDILNQFDGLILEHNNHKAKNLVEVIISNNSNLINKKINESNFRTKFDASVVSIRRGEEKILSSIGNTSLQAGDNLLLAIGKDFHKRDNINKNFYVVADILLQQKLNLNHSIIVASSFLFVLLLSLFNILPLIKGLFILLSFYLFQGYLRLEEIKRRLPYELVIIIGSALSIAVVMIESGVANSLALFLNNTLGSYGIYGSFIGIYLLTFILTELITNNAAAALSFPIAYATSVSLDVSYLPFIFAVAYGASASFMTPYGYQTNLMVASIGGYSLKDFLKTGFIVSIIYSLIVLTLIPLFFPF